MPRFLSTGDSFGSVHRGHYCQGHLREHLGASESRIHAGANGGDLERNTTPIVLFLIFMFFIGWLIACMIHCSVVTYVVMYFLMPQTLLPQ